MVFTERQKQVWGLFKFVEFFGWLVFLVFCVCVCFVLALGFCLVVVVVVFPMGDAGVLLITGMCFQREMDAKTDSCCYQCLPSFQRLCFAVVFLWLPV